MGFLNGQLVIESGFVTFNLQCRITGNVRIVFNIVQRSICPLNKIRCILWGWQEKTVETSTLSRCYNDFSIRLQFLPYFLVV